MTLPFGKISVGDRVVLFRSSFKNHDGRYYLFSVVYLLPKDLVYLVSFHGYIERIAKLQDVFNPLPSSAYRLVEPGELILETDEAYGHNGWYAIGFTAKNTYHDIAIRRLVR